MFQVYRHIRQDTGKPFYVGKGSGQRWKDLKNRNAYHKSIQAKTGIRCQIVAKFEDEESAFRFEEKLIKVYKSFGMAEANFSTGGRGGASGTKKPHKADFMRKMNIANKGKPITWTPAREAAALAMIGTKRSEDSVRKTAEYHRGKKRSPETRARISTAKSGKPLSLEHRQKLSSSCKKAKIHTMKSVFCVETGKVFESLKAASRFLKTSKSNISTVLNNPNRTCKGFHWRYC